MSLSTRLVVLSALLWASSESMVHAGNNVWTSLGPEGGFVHALAVDPGTPATLYAGTHGGGVFAITFEAAATLADLIVENLTVTPSGGPAGAPAPVSFTIRNQGSGLAPTSTTNIGLAASNTSVTTNDPLLAHVNVPAIAVGHTFSVVNQAVTMPNVSVGSYFVWVIADVGHTANQGGNETNDKALTPFAVTAQDAGESTAMPGRV